MLTTVSNTQLGSWSYLEKSRGRKEIEVARKRRGGVNRGETNLASNQFPKCSPQSGSLRDVHGVTQRRGSKVTKVARIKWGIKRRETDPASNQFPKCSPQPGTHKKNHRVG